MYICEHEVQEYSNISVSKSSMSRAALILYVISVDNYMCSYVCIQNKVHHFTQSLKLFFLLDTIENIFIYV